MNGACTETIKMNVEIQSNGIIRNSKGYLIGRLSNDMEFNSEHVALIEDAEIIKEISEDLDRYFVKGLRSVDEKWFANAIRQFVIDSCTKYHEKKGLNKR